MEKKRDGCSRHPGERKLLVCVEPCKAHVCQKCLNDHPKHEIRTFESVGETLVSLLQASTQSTAKEYNVVTTQLKILAALKSDITGHLDEKIREEQKLEIEMLEPLKEIIDGFKAKVRDLVRRLDAKRELCALAEKEAQETLQNAQNDIATVKEAIAKEDTHLVFEKWLASANNPKFSTPAITSQLSPSIPTSEPEPEPRQESKTEEEQAVDETSLDPDIETLKDYTNDLKKLSISDNMKIVVWTLMSALQQQTQDPISQMRENLRKKAEEVQALKELTENSQTLLAKMMQELEGGQRRLEKDTKAYEASVAAFKKRQAKKLPTKPEELASLKSALDISEELLKSIRDSCIHDIKKAEAEKNVIDEKHKALAAEESIMGKKIQVWLKELAHQDRDYSELKKMCHKMTDSLLGYTKFLKKIDIQYVVKLQDFEKLDARLQYIRAFIAQHTPPEDDNDLPPQPPFQSPSQSQSSSKPESDSESQAQSQSQSQLPLTPNPLLAVAQQLPSKTEEQTTLLAQQQPILTTTLNATINLAPNGAEQPRSLETHKSQDAKHLQNQHQPQEEFKLRPDSSQHTGLVPNKPKDSDPHTNQPQPSVEEQKTGNAQGQSTKPEATSEADLPLAEDKVQEREKEQRQEGHEEEAAIGKQCKLRLSIVDASSERFLSRPLLHMFLYGTESTAAGGGYDETYTGVQGHSLTLQLPPSTTVEFIIWYLGCKEDIAAIDDAYCKNVDAIFIVYNMHADPQANITAIEDCLTRIPFRSFIHFCLLSCIA